MPGCMQVGPASSVKLAIAVTVGGVGRLMRCRYILGTALVFNWHQHHGDHQSDHVGIIHAASSD